MRRRRYLPLALGAFALAGSSVSAQSTTSPRPWGRVSFFVNTSAAQADGAQQGSSFTDATTSVTYQFPDVDGSGAEYGVDLRYSVYSGAERPARVSIYEGYIGGRFANGAMRVRAGNLWLTDLGALGSVAGGLFEWRQPREKPSDGRIRAGVFGGLEPDLFRAGYAPNVTKFGGYVAYDADHGQRSVAGLVTVRNASLTERTVLTFSNFLPIRQKVFVYQAAEVDVRPPAGQAQAGVTYFFANVRWTATSRLDLQGTYNRGRSIDVRGLSEDVLNGRPILQRNVNGLLYESIGGRATVTVATGVRVYGGYSSDKTDRDAARTGRLLVGGYAGNLARSGIDLTASDSIIDRPDGSSYQSRYVAAGHQFGRRFYLSGDYSTSLSVVRFTRADGVTVEFQPHTRRYSATGTWNVNRTISLLVTGERARDDTVSERRLLCGITFRIPNR